MAKKGVRTAVVVGREVYGSNNVGGQSSDDYRPFSSKITN
jgi:hypothetical protein